MLHSCQARNVESPVSCSLFCFFFNDTATTEIYTLSLHDALPICYGHQWRALRMLYLSPLGSRQGRWRVRPLPQFVVPPTGPTTAHCDRFLDASVACVARFASWPALPSVSRKCP